MKTFTYDLIPFFPCFTIWFYFKWNNFAIFTNIFLYFFLETRTRNRKKSWENCGLSDAHFIQITMNVLHSQIFHMIYGLFFSIYIFRHLFTNSTNILDKISFHFQRTRDFFGFSHHKNNFSLFCFLFFLCAYETKQILFCCFAFLTSLTLLFKFSFIQMFWLWYISFHIFFCIIHIIYIFLLLFMIFFSCILSFILYWYL